MHGNGGCVLSLAVLRCGMTETIHFKYKSVENFVRLLVTIQYEKTHNAREIHLFHRRFDKENDDIFYQFLIELFPEGGNIGEEELKALVKHIEHFLDTDEEAKDISVEWDMQHQSSYVFFKIDKKVYNCSYASHQQTVKNICVDYFKGFDPHELSVEMVEKFITENFVVKSDFSTAETIARDARYIRDCIIFNDD